MLAELGHFALVLALVVALLQAVLPLVGVSRGQIAWQRFARPAAVVQCLCLLLAFGGLAWAFLHNDFTFDYVARQSNTLLPVYYKISAIWGGHEGSLLLWVTVLSLWGAAVAIFGRGLPREMTARVLAIMGMVNVAMMSFVLITSNPFRRNLPDFPLDGADLNPLLQDPGLIFHPPLLYMGYVGFTVPFAFALSGLLGGRLDSAWARWSRPWTIAAWGFLTLGIALGSWWAYYELGWGGWWFWDPVENASFMPWLAGTALLHSLAVSEKRGVFKAWTVMLAIIAFALSLLGTFLVRSGVLTSVHAFAADPARGLFVLGILVAVIGGSLLVFALRAGELNSESRYQWFSRESFLLANNLLLITATSVVLLGTLFPLIADALHLGKISVGPPYFNALFVPLAFLLLLFLGVGPLVNWKRHDARRLIKPLLAVMASAVALGVVLPWIVHGSTTIKVSLALTLCLWVFFSMMRDVWIKASTAKAGFLAGLRRLPAAYIGMQLGHLGLLVTVVGVTLTSAFSIEKDVRVGEGHEVRVADYRVVWKGVREVAGPNYISTEGAAELYRPGEVKPFRTLQPEKRRYLAGGQVMTETSIDGGLLRDVYIAMGEPLEGGQWAVRVYYKPFVRWMWLGALIMALGGAVAASDRRYRLSNRRESVVVSKGERAA